MILLELFLEKELNETFKSELNVGNLEVSRLDLAQNIYFDTNDEVNQFINVFKDFKLDSRKKKTIYPTGVEFKTTSSKLVIYNKKVELQAHYPEDDFSNVPEIARLEFQIKRKELMEIFDKNPLTLSDVLNFKDICDFAYRSELKRYKINCEFPSENQLDSLLDICHTNSTEKMRLLFSNYIRAIKKHSNINRLHIKESRIKSFENDIKNAGYFPRLIDNIKQINKYYLNDSVDSVESNSDLTISSVLEHLDSENMSA